MLSPVKVLLSLQYYGDARKCTSLSKSTCSTLPEFFPDRYFQRARDVGAAHGFFSVECRSCLGLGQIAVNDGRAEEGLDLLRNALAGPSTLYPKPKTQNLKP